MESILSNISIILLMNLTLNVLTTWDQDKVVSSRLIQILYIGITVLGVYTLSHMPIYTQYYFYDLKIIPIVFISILIGPKIMIPSITLLIALRYLEGGGMVLHDIAFGLVFPALISLNFYPFVIRKNSIYKIWGILTIVAVACVAPEFIIFHGNTRLFLEYFLEYYFWIMLSSTFLFFFLFTFVQSLKLKKKLKFLAERDSLTNLYNMRKFEQKLEEWMKQDKNIYIGMVDIDLFKRINDTYGHCVGDEIIRKVSKVFIGYTHSNELLVARYGGDEFIFAIWANSLADASKILEEIRVEISNYPFVINDGEITLQLSISGGVSELSEFSKLNLCIKTSDRKLYDSKEAGRNQICS